MAPPQGDSDPGRGVFSPWIKTEPRHPPGPFAVCPALSRKGWSSQCNYLESPWRWRSASPCFPAPPWCPSPAPRLPGRRLSKPRRRLRRPRLPRSRKRRFRRPAGPRGTRARAHDTPPPPPPPPPPPVEEAPLPAPAVAEIDADELECLAKVVLHEAGNQSRTGQLAVAQVVMNRVRSPRFPDTVCDVVMQRGQFFNVHPYHPRSDPRRATAVEAPRDALSGESEPVIGNALFFHAASAASFRRT